MQEISCLKQYRIDTTDILGWWCRDTKSSKPGMGALEDNVAGKVTKTIRTNIEFLKYAGNKTSRLVFSY